MASSQRVLVVDGLTETEEVLRAVLEPRGLQVNRIRTAETENAFQDDLPPDVVVFHADETGPHATDAVPWQNVPCVIIGTVRLPAGDGHAGNSKDCHLRNPFQYAELIQAIEGLLDQRD